MEKLNNEIDPNEAYSSDNTGQQQYKTTLNINKFIKRHQRKVEGESPTTVFSNHHHHHHKIIEMDNEEEDEDDDDTFDRRMVLQQSQNIQSMGRNKIGYTTVVNQSKTIENDGGDKKKKKTSKKVA